MNFVSFRVYLMIQRGNFFCKTHRYDADSREYFEQLVVSRS